jgi:hypothetical protein
MIQYTPDNLKELFYNMIYTMEPDYFLEIECFEASASKKISTKLVNCKVIGYKAI